MKFLSGYKTYIVGVITILFGITQCAGGTADLGIQNILVGLAMLTGRAAISKVTK